MDGWLLDMFVGDAKALRVKAKDIKFVHAGVTMIR